MISTSDPLTQSAVPVVSVRPEMITLESASVVNVTSFVPDGVKVEFPFAANALDAVNVPVTVAAPAKLVAPVPRNEKVGLVVAFPNEIFSLESVVLILI